MSQIWLVILSFLLLQTDGLVVITENDWHLLCEEWLVPEGKGVIAEVDLDVGSSQVNTSRLQMDTSNDQPNSEVEPLKPIIRTVPEVRDFSRSSANDIKER